MIPTGVAQRPRCQRPWTKPGQCQYPGFQRSVGEVVQFGTFSGIIILVAGLGQ